MSENQNNYWESIYTKDTAKLPTYDGWLDKYVPTLKSSRIIIDLGCGLGVNTVYLHGMGIKTIPCDFSRSALAALASRLPDLKTYCFDITQGLPFGSESADVVIADLSLHYFSKAITKAAISDIRRMLKPGGLLLCRVNAYEEGFDQAAYAVIETDYYVVNGCTKRFFTLGTMRHFFQDWHTIQLAEQETMKYGFAKPTIMGEFQKP